MTITKTWKLPKPDPGPEYNWQPVVRLGHQVPFGYKQDPEDKDILLPIPEELELLEYAKKLLKEYSLREVAAWLSRESGRYISFRGLKKRVDLEEKRRTKAGILRFYQKKAEEAACKAEALERQIGGRIAKGLGPGDS